MPGSSCQYCSRSLPETSARLPAETKLDRPEPAPVGLGEQRHAERAGLAEEAHPARRPAAAGASVAFRRTAGSVLAMPRQFGPTTPQPARVRGSISSRCAAAPAAPASAKPAETTTRPPAPARGRVRPRPRRRRPAARRSPPGRPRPGRRRRTGTRAARPPGRRARCTGTIAPVNPPSRRWPSMAAPMPVPAGAGAVDRDPARAQQPGDRPRLGALLAALLHLAATARWARSGSSGAPRRRRTGAAPGSRRR